MVGEEAARAASLCIRRRPVLATALVCLPAARMLARILKHAKLLTGWPSWGRLVYLTSTGRFAIEADRGRVGGHPCRTSPALAGHRRGTPRRCDGDRAVVIGSDSTGRPTSSHAGIHAAASEPAPVLKTWRLLRRLWCRVRPEIRCAASACRLDRGRAAGMMADCAGHAAGRCP